MGLEDDWAEVRPEPLPPTDMAEMQDKQMRKEVVPGAGAVDIQRFLSRLGVNLDSMTVRETEDGMIYASGPPEYVGQMPPARGLLLTDGHIDDMTVAELTDEEIQQLERQERAEAEHALQQAHVAIRQARDELGDTASDEAIEQRALELMSPMDQAHRLLASRGLGPVDEQPEDDEQGQGDDITWMEAERLLTGAGLAFHRDRESGNMGGGRNVIEGGQFRAYGEGYIIEPPVDGRPWRFHYHTGGVHSMNTVEERLETVVERILLAFTHVETVYIDVARNRLMFAGMQVNVETPPLRMFGGIDLDGQGRPISRWLFEIRERPEDDPGLGFVTETASSPHLTEHLNLEQAVAFVIEQFEQHQQGDWGVEAERRINQAGLGCRVFGGLQQGRFDWRMIGGTSLDERGDGPGTWQNSFVIDRDEDGSFRGAVTGPGNGSAESAGVALDQAVDFVLGVYRERGLIDITDNEAREILEHVHDFELAWETDPWTLVGGRNPPDGQEGRFDNYQECFAIVRHDGFYRVTCTGHGEPLVDMHYPTYDRAVTEVLRYFAEIATIEQALAALTDNGLVAEHTVEQIMASLQNGRIDGEGFTILLRDDRWWAHIAHGGSMPHRTLDGAVRHVTDTLRPPDDEYSFSSLLD